jgi:hypothetical protein
MTRMMTFVSAVVLSAGVMTGMRALAALPHLRVPATACAVQTGSGPVTFQSGSGATASAVVNTPSTLLCPVVTDEPGAYNRFNAHVTDFNSGASIRGAACVDFFNVQGASCSADFELTGAAFRTPTGEVTGATTPVFSVWQDNLAHFAYVKLTLPPRGNCGGPACHGPCGLVGLFVFSE